jgi:hypothetical protein
MSDKKYSAQEAAIMVLKKAEELYKLSSLAKSEDLKKGDWAKIHSKLKREGYSEESADKIDGAIKAKMNKSDDMGNNPDAQADAQLGEKVEQDVQQHEKNNEDPGHTMKGHIKLAKFMGRMEHKKEQSAKMQKDAPTLGATIGFPGAAATAPSPSPTATPSPTMGKSEGKK